MFKILTRPCSLASRLNFACSRSFAVRISPEALPSKPTEEVLRPVSLETANAQQVLHDKYYHAIQKYKQHHSDTGSPAVQIAVMTEKIQHLSKHFARHKKDKHGHRGFMVNNLLICLPLSIFLSSFFNL